MTGLTGGRFVITWSSSNSGGRLGPLSEHLRPGRLSHRAGSGVSDVVSSVTYLENTVNAAPQAH